MEKIDRKFPPVIPPPTKEKTQLPPQDKLQKQSASESMLVLKVCPKYTLAWNGDTNEQLTITVCSNASRNKMPRLRIKPGMEIKVTITQEVSPYAKSKR